MQSVHNQIYNKITKHKRGMLFFPTEFSAMGSVSSVNMALSRLQKEGVIERIAQGIYLYPKIDPLFGKMYPSTEEIAANIAKRDHARIIPTGAMALQKLGLSTQVPMNLVYLTDGAPRKIQIGKQNITFKTTTAKKLAIKGPVSSLVIQALEELGKNKFDKDLQKRVLQILKNETLKNLEHDAKLAPAWIAALLKQAAIKIKE
ncbi:MAG TPA: DUF6088 family protein [Pelobium sp.]|nr:DUF6088 family protein [Pelobium sp.]